MGKIEIYENFSESGTEILRCRIRLFYSDESAGTEEFYRKIAENSYEYVKKELLNKARAEYSSDGRENKRYRFNPFIYKLSGEVTFDGDGLFSQRVEMWLTHGRDVISQFKDGHVWQKSDGMLLPPKAVLKKYGVGKGIKFESVTVSERGVDILFDGKWKNCPIC